jgi:hypothetical protein
MRPGVLLEDGTTTKEHASRTQEFESHIPSHITFDHTPHTVCWQGIELFYLPNKDGNDIPCAIINYRNMKGSLVGVNAKVLDLCRASSGFLAYFFQRFPASVANAMTLLEEEGYHQVFLPLGNRKQYLNKCKDVLH